MAFSVTVQRPDLFPATTKVKVFALPAVAAGELLKNNSGDPTNWLPKLTKTQEPEVTSAGKLEMFSMVKNVRYLLWAEVGSKDVYLVQGVPLEGAPQGTTSGDPRVVKVKTTSTELLAANASREGLRVENLDPANQMFIGIAGGNAKLKDDIGPILPKGGVWDGTVGGKLWTGAVFGIAETAELEVSVSEV